MRLFFFWWAFCMTLLYGCSPSGTTEVEIPLGDLKAGDWLLTLQLNDSVSLPINVEVNNASEMVFINGEERIVAQLDFIAADSLHIVMPFFENAFHARVGEKGERLTGYWYNFTKDDYSIPFTATAGSQARFCIDSKNTDLADHYEVHFSPGSTDEYPAVGLFKQGPSGTVLGTFATETGDYRFLEGGVCGETLSLSCFDGSHAFLFTAILSGDSLVNGQFYSGSHWNEPWQAHVNLDFDLRDPYTLTEIVDSSALGQTRFILEDGSFLSLDDLRKPGEVSIIQVMGSWCPNCMDESLFFKSLFNQYNSSGLSILPLAFESSDDPVKAYTAIHKLETDLELPFPIYY